MLNEITPPAEQLKQPENEVRPWKKDDIHEISAHLESVWPEWLRDDEATLLERTEVFPAGQILIRDPQTHEVLGYLSTNRIKWDGTVSGLPTSWDAVARDKKGKNTYRDTYVEDGNTMVLMAVVVHPGHPGKGIADELLQNAQKIAKALGIANIISPNRPNKFGEYRETDRTTDFETYIQLKKPEADVPLDPWLRVLARNGMKALDICTEAMRVEADITTFEKYRNDAKNGFYQLSSTPDEVWGYTKGPGTWTVDRLKNTAVYTEPNVWQKMDF